jgi:Domain of unknown function (DUF4145)
MPDNIKNAPCIVCTRVNAHRVLAREDRSDDEITDRYYFLACAGCGAVSMANLWNSGGHDEARYYPSPISRKPPTWLWQLRFLFGNDETPLGELLHEIYEAVQGKQHRLALMGIRAFFEQLMIAKVGDQGNFTANLNAFLEAGFIAKIKLTAIKHILESGHAAIHRGYKPVEQDLNTALNIVEAITETIYFHEDEAKQVAARVPPRASVKVKQPGTQFIAPSTADD